MIIKEEAKKTIDLLPDNAAYDDIIHALYVRAKFENGLQDIMDGRSVSNEAAKERLQKWVK